MGELSLSLDSDSLERIPWRIYTLDLRRQHFLICYLVTVLLQPFVLVRIEMNRGVSSRTWPNRCGHDKVRNTIFYERDDAFLGNKSNDKPKPQDVAHGAHRGQLRMCASCLTSPLEMTGWKPNLTQSSLYPIKEEMIHLVWTFPCKMFFFFAFLCDEALATCAQWCIALGTAPHVCTP
jgi:hypothetical protein